MLDGRAGIHAGQALAEHGDTEAAHQLVTSHLRLVAKIAMGYRGYGLPIGEVISEGNVGLMQAVKKFDPDKGFRLATYAMWWIRASIQEYILRSWSLVKMGTTAAQKKLFFNLRRLKGEIAALEEGDLRPEHVATIAHKLAVTEDEVISMNRRLAAAATPRSTRRCAATAKATASGRTGSPTTDAARRKRALADSEELETRRSCCGGDGALNERERHIIQERRLKDEPATLEDLSKEYGVSRERVRQIEVRAFEKLQKRDARAGRRARDGAGGELTRPLRREGSAGLGRAKARHSAGAGR